MDEFPDDHDDYDKITITPLLDDNVHEDEVEGTRIARHRLARRRFLRRSMLAVGGLAAATCAAGALTYATGVLYTLYPNLSQQFGSKMDLGRN